VLSRFLEKYEIHGTKTILKRNHLELIKSLKNIGFNVSSTHSGLPLSISATKKLESNILIDGSEGSQFLSGMLMLCPFLTHDTHIIVENLTSKPYTDLTIKTIEQFKGCIDQMNYSDFKISGNQKIHAETISVDGDWSSMAFHIVGASLNGHIEISGLSMNSKQADELVLSIVEDFGAILDVTKNKIRVKSSKKNPIHVSLVNAPDLFPAIAVLACGAIGKSTLKGISRLLNKESNRLKSICNMLEVFQVEYEILADELSIYGNGLIQGGNVITYGDHRIAMAAVTASTIANSDISIDDADCVQKSYRNYFRDMYIMMN
jgi:3-phosphoshikimate 1-carboxyvinyltransferase